MIADPELDRPSAAEFRALLLAAQVLFPGGADGLYQRSAVFESIVEGVTRLALAAGADQQAQVRYFGPVLPRAVFERTDYLRSFPDLVGSIDTFVGDDADHARLLRIAADDGDWTTELTPAEVVLAPAICHSLYPTLTGEVPAEGRVFAVNGSAFRHEPSLDPARMQTFRMQEFVYVGTPAGAVAHRDEWLRRGLTLLGDLGLPVRSVVANDPFFGRAGRMLAANQRATELKYEIVVAITDGGPTAIASANCHEDHFGSPFAIATPDGAPAHSSCFGFGLERITLALLSRHGTDPQTWPEAVRAQLWP